MPEQQEPPPTKKKPQQKKGLSTDDILSALIMDKNSSQDPKTIYGKRENEEEKPKKEPPIPTLEYHRPPPKPWWMQYPPYGQGPPPGAHGGHSPRPQHRPHMQPVRTDSARSGRDNLSLPRQPNHSPSPARSPARSPRVQHHQQYYPPPEEFRSDSERQGRSDSPVRFDSLRSGPIRTSSPTRNNIEEDEVQPQTQEEFQAEVQDDLKKYKPPLLPKPKLFSRKKHEPEPEPVEPLQEMLQKPEFKEINAQYETSFGYSYLPFIKEQQQKAKEAELNKAQSPERAPAPKPKADRWTRKQKKTDPSNEPQESTENENVVMRKKDKPATPKRTSSLYENRSHPTSPTRSSTLPRQEKPGIHTKGDPNQIIVDDVSHPGYQEDQPPFYRRADVMPSLDAIKLKQKQEELKKKQERLRREEGEKQKKEEEEKIRKEEEERKEQDRLAEFKWKKEAEEKLHREEVFQKQEKEIENKIRNRLMKERGFLKPDNEEVTITLDESKINQQPSTSSQNIHETSPLKLDHKEIVPPPVKLEQKEMVPPKMVTNQYENNLDQTLESDVGSTEWDTTWDDETGYSDDFSFLNESKDIDDAGPVPRKARKRPTVVRRNIKPSERMTTEVVAKESVPQQPHFQKVTLEDKSNDDDEAANPLQTSNKYVRKPVPKPRSKVQASVEVYDQAPPDADTSTEDKRSSNQIISELFAKGIPGLKVIAHESNSNAETSHEEIRHENNPSTRRTVRTTKITKTYHSNELHEDSIADETINSTFENTFETDRSPDITTESTRQAVKDAVEEHVNDMFETTQTSEISTLEKNKKGKKKEKSKFGIKSMFGKKKKDDSEESARSEEENVDDQEKKKKKRGKKSKKTVSVSEEIQESSLRKKEKNKLGKAKRSEVEDMTEPSVDKGESVEIMTNGHIKPEFRQREVKKSNGSYSSTRKAKEKAKAKQKQNEKMHDFEDNYDDDRESTSSYQARFVSANKDRGIPGAARTSVESSFEPTADEINKVRLRKQIRKNENDEVFDDNSLDISNLDDVIDERDTRKREIFKMLQQETSLDSKIKRLEKEKKELEEKQEEHERVKRRQKKGVRPKSGSFSNRNSTGSDLGMPLDTSCESLDEDSMKILEKKIEIYYEIKKRQKIRMLMKKMMNEEGKRMSEIINQSTELLNLIGQKDHELYGSESSDGDITEQMKELEYAGQHHVPDYPVPDIAPPTTTKEDIFDDPEVFEELDTEVIEVATRIEHKHYNKLIKDLTKNCTTELEIVRAIFRWITVKDLNRVRLDENASKQSLHGILRGIRNGTESYHDLFKRLCGYADLHCEIIHGFSKGMGYRPGMRVNDPRFRNTWTAVNVDGEWRFINCNWGARHTKGKDGDSKDFHYRCDEFYFLTEPEEHIFQHYPDNPKWQLLKGKVTLSQYAKLPVLKSPFFNNGLKLKGNYTEKLFTIEGRVEIKLRMDNYVGLYSTLEHLGERGVEKVKDGHTLITVMDNEVSLIVQPPDIGRYYLNIYTSDNYRSSSLEHACSFLLVAGDDCYDNSSNGTFPPVGMIGATPMLRTLGMSIPSEQDPFSTVSWQKEFFYPFSLTTEVRLSHQMKHFNRRGQYIGDYDNYVFLKYKGHKGYMVRCPKEGYFVLAIFATDANGDAQKLDCVLKYLIDCEEPLADAKPFPRPSRRWIGNNINNLYEPSSGELPVNSRIPFKIEIPEACEVIVIVGKMEPQNLEYSEHEDDVWESTIFTGTKNRVNAQILARYDSESDRFSPLLEYRIVEKK